jgi:formylglycine-generating enzyme required for sulfatase activity
MGSSDDDELADDDEKPQHELTLDTYWIGKTEVTNAQFRPFVAGDGYRNRDYWTDAGWRWREEEGIVQPEYWDDPKWNGDDYPVVRISWFEAVAYARWVSAQTGEELRLPTEAEWEKAARGPDGLIWPWGNTWKEGLCNSKEAGIGKTTLVGNYPKGASPYGALDMAGNVWEWTATKWQKDYPYQIEDEWSAEYLAGDSVRMLRGGSWVWEQQYVRGADRISNYPRFRIIDVGLRLASHSPLPGSDE